MTNINRHNLIWFLALNMSLCLIVHAGLIYHPNVYDDDRLTMSESNGLLNNGEENSDRNDKYQTYYHHQSLLPYLYDDNIIRQLLNQQKNAKRSRLNLHTNLNLPRYLRTVD